MVDTIVTGLAEETKMLRQLEKHWNGGLIAASIAISLLGTFTSTQLMCQARTSRHFSGILVWSILASLTFGFCSIWSLHEVAMLACELDLPIGIDVPLTILSAMLAVVFTFAAIASDLLWNSYNRARKSGRPMRTKKSTRNASFNWLSSNTRDTDASEALLDPFEQEDEEPSDSRRDLEPEHSSRYTLSQRLPLEVAENAVLDAGNSPDSRFTAQTNIQIDPAQPSLFLSLDNKSLAETRVKDFEHTLELRAERSDDTISELRMTESLQRTSDDRANPRRSSSIMGSSSSKFKMSNIMSLNSYRKSSSSTKNAIIVMYIGFTRRNLIKGFLWSLAITGMHYVGVLALHIPKGHLIFNPILVALSGLISWIVCLTGCILMPQMEVHLLQQFLFSIVATGGVAAMHFTGMVVYLTDFRTAEPYAQGCERRRFGLISHHLILEATHRPLLLLLLALLSPPVLQPMPCWHILRPFRVTNSQRSF
jgi:NO-binding membrane sensor protein with MHYT domain